MQQNSHANRNTPPSDLPAASTHTASPPVGRVALVLTELRPGGMERVVAQLAMSLPHYGVQTMVICLQGEGLLARELNQAGIPVVALESRRGYDLKALWKLRRLLDRFRPDVVNIHDYSSLPYVVVANLARPKRPLIFTAHGLLYGEAAPSQRRCRLFARGITSLIAVSSQVRDRHESFLGWNGPTCVVPNGVPDIPRSSDIARQVRQELAVADDDFVFLAIGNPRPEKAFEDLVSAAARLQARHPARPFAVWIAGTLSDSPYCQDLQARVHASKVPGLRLLGFRADAARLYSAADALVLSSRSEGLPMVVLEAMMSRLPVIATRVGAVPEAIPQGGGILVSPESPNELAQAMEQLLTADRLQRERMGELARQRATDQYGIGAMVDGYLRAYASSCH